MIIYIYDIGLVYNGRPQGLYRGNDKNGKKYIMGATLYMYISFSDILSMISLNRVQVILFEGTLEYLF